MSELLAIGVSHKTAPVEVRERLALPEARAQQFVRELRGCADVREVVTISTCNRTELYLVVGDAVEAEGEALAMLASQAGIRGRRQARPVRRAVNGQAARPIRAHPAASQSRRGSGRIGFRLCRDGPDQGHHSGRLHAQSPRDLLG